MSKRAEELVDGILDFIVYRSGHPDKPMALKDRMRGLVDAELRKERERCAERAKKYVESVHYLDCEYERDRWGIDDEDMRAAILEADE